MYLLNKSFAIKLRKPASHCRLQLIMAVSEQEQQGMRRGAPRQVVEKIQAGVVAPVHIFYDQKDGGMHRAVNEKFR